MCKKKVCQSTIKFYTIFIKHMYLVKKQKTSSKKCETAMAKRFYKNTYSDRFWKRRIKMLTESDLNIIACERLHMLLAPVGVT